jgi:plastocyanin
VAKDGRFSRSRGWRLLPAGLCALACLVAPGGAAAATETQKITYGPISVDGYGVNQAIAYDGVAEPDLEGHITAMRANIVDEDGKAVPIRRLMLHHIVFLNLGKPDSTCSAIQGFDAGVPPFAFSAERFYAMGEERARLQMPEGYGYPVDGNDQWAILFMVMNHRPDLDRAYIEYEVTVDDDPGIEPVKPYWMDVANCSADPIYNVPGTGPDGSTDTLTERFTFPQAGRIVAGGGHVHGGARMLTLTEPSCADRELVRSTPTWGRADHPFYNVKPVLHEPGPVNMTAFRTTTGIPVTAGDEIELNSLYDAAQPHTRVMGIMIVYLDQDSSVTEACSNLPGDVETLGTDYDGRTEPIPFRVPLTGINEKGRAETIAKPPGRLRRLASGSTVKVRDHKFSRPNISLRRGADLNWRFDGPDLHNVTLANGPEAIGSPNYGAGGNTFEHSFDRRGTYRLFCALHPTQMAERVVVGKRRRR